MSQKESEIEKERGRRGETRSETGWGREHVTHCLSQQSTVSKLVANGGHDPDSEGEF